MACVAGKLCGCPYGIRLAPGPPTTLTADASSLYDNRNVHAVKAITKAELLSKASGDLLHPSPTIKCLCGLGVDLLDRSGLSGPRSREHDVYHITTGTTSPRA